MMKDALSISNKFQMGRIWQNVNQLSKGTMFGIDFVWQLPRAAMSQWQLQIVLLRQ